MQDHDTRGPSSAPETVEHTVRVHDPEGFHVRPCAAIARAVQAFDSDVEVLTDRGRAGGRSIMEMLALEAPHGAEIRIRATGHDARACMEAILDVLRDATSVA